MAYKEGELARLRKTITAMRGQMDALRVAQGTGFREIRILNNTGIAGGV